MPQFPMFMPPPQLSGEPRPLPTQLPRREGWRGIADDVLGVGADALQGLAGGLIPGIPTPDSKTGRVSRFIGEAAPLAVPLMGGISKGVGMLRGGAGVAEEAMQGLKGLEASTAGFEGAAGAKPMGPAQSEMFRRLGPYDATAAAETRLGTMGPKTQLESMTMPQLSNASVGEMRNDIRNTPFDELVKGLGNGGQAKPTTMPSQLPPGAGYRPTAAPPTAGAKVLSEGPAVDELIKMLDTPLAKPDLNAAALGQRTTGRAVPPTKLVRPPEGFELSGGRKSTQINRTPEMKATYERQAQIRTNIRNNPILEPTQDTPVVRGVEELQDINPTSVETSGRKPLAGKFNYGRGTSKLTVNDVKAIKQAQREGLKAKEIHTNYPGVAYDTIASILQGNTWNKVK